MWTEKRRGSSSLNACYSLNKDIGCCTAWHNSDCQGLSCKMTLLWDMFLCRMSWNTCWKSRGTYGPLPSYMQVKEWAQKLCLFGASWQEIIHLAYGKTSFWRLVYRIAGKTLFLARQLLQLKLQRFLRSHLTKIWFSNI